MVKKGEPYGLAFFYHIFHYTSCPSAITVS